MFDLDNPTRYNRSPTELEEFLIYCICLAGRPARVWAKKVETFLGDSSPFTLIRSLKDVASLEEILRVVRMGRYKQLAAALFGVATSRLDLRTCAQKDLAVLVGQNVTRFFLTHTRPGFTEIALDACVLAFLKTLGHSAPSKDMNLTREGFLRDVFLKEAAKRNLTPARLQAWCWKTYRKG